MQIEDFAMTKTVRHEGSFQRAGGGASLVQV